MIVFRSGSQSHVVDFGVSGLQVNQLSIYLAEILFDKKISIINLNIQVSH